MATEVHFDIALADGFILTELAGVVDVLRLSNRISRRPVFRWHYRSVAGGNVTGSSDAIIQTTALPARPDADYLFVLGNADADCPALSLGATLANYTNRQARVILLSEAASRYIADKRDAGAKHTTHWENRAVLLERLGLFDTKSALVVDAGSVITCAGMGATVDVALSLASQHMSSAAMMTVADILLHERIRHYNTLQPFAGRAALATGDQGLDAAIELMQAHIEFPLSISQIASETRLSKRSLERKFNAVLRATPNGYYRELRLNKANNLLLNTDMRINEIGLACGFPSGFTAIYKDMFGMTPSTARKKGRQK
ncbi:helix-turn-helix domain-containing protein [Yoonia sp. SS1-5]|uniref:GlxA family transcriptional regulator n=1 Tax=Yoonia rhodophyticola TaxID=3137370 RepID=A0AAN0MA89_9RHOB